MTTCFKYILSVNANAKLIIQCSPQTHTLTNHIEIQNHLTRKYQKLATRIVQLAKYELNWTRKLKLPTRTFQLATPNSHISTRNSNSHSNSQLATRTRNLQLATHRIPQPCLVLVYVFNYYHYHRSLLKHNHTKSVCLKRNYWIDFPI